MTPLISIIIPVYNRQKELLLSLSTIKKQTYRPLEVIIVDDGSSQEVKFFKLEIFKKLEEIPFQIVRRENKGAPAARNHGFQLSKGEFVIFWDTDILGNPNMIEKMFDTLQHHKEASFAYSNHIHAQKIKFRAQEFDVEKLKQNNYINTVSLIRRSDAPTWDESFRRFQDWDLFLTLAQQGKKGVWIDEFLFSSLPTATGISYWLPSIAYKSPWKYFPFWYKKVKSYEAAKKIIFDKHGL